MIKIGIIESGSPFNWGKNFGYWFPVKYFLKQLKDSGYEIKFYRFISKSFLKSDIIIINNNYFKYNLNNKIKSKLGFFPKINYLERIKEIRKKNPNIIWLDLTDSAGTTSFELLPYIKKYVKKQFYKNKDLYRKSFFRDRFYADFYQTKYNVEKFSHFKNIKLLPKYDKKLLLGWNIGVGKYFDIINYQKFYKKICIFKNLFNYDLKSLDNYFLKFHINLEKKKKIFYRYNLRKFECKSSIHFQRIKVNEILNSLYESSENYLEHKKFLSRLMDAKVSVGAFGWGEICYREFEATYMGAANVFPNIDYIETWPNIYQNNISYAAYKFDLSDLEEKIDLVCNNNSLREKLVYNSQKKCRDVYTDVGFKYFSKFFKNISI